MIKQEWKKLLKNKVLMIVLIAIIAIPSIYTALFLGSMWDPYGKLDQLPVAVVNKDQSAEYNGKELNVGSSLVENLKENDSLQFHFVNAHAAKMGIEDGSYYMVITIPEDFSANAATLMDEHPRKMQLKYETNPGTNYIASKMSESALEKIKESVSEEVTKEYTQAVFDSFTEAADGMTEAADGAGVITQGISDASSGNQTITENLQTLADSTLEFQSGSQVLTASLKDYTDGTARINDGAGQLKDGTDTLQKAAGEGADQLNQGALSLKSGIASYTSGVEQAYEGTAQLKENSKALVQGTEELAGGAEKAQKGSETLTAGLKELSQTIGKQSQEGSESLKAVKQGLDQLGDGIQAVDENLVQIQKQLLAAGDDTGAAAIGQLLSSKEYQTLVAGSSTVTDGAKTAITQLDSGTKAVKDTLDQQIIPGSQDLTAGLEELNQGISGKNGLSAGVDAYTQGVSKVNEGLAQLNKSSSQLENGAEALDEGTAQLSSELGSGISKIQNAAGQLWNGTAALVSNNGALLSGSSKLSSGAAQIAEGSGALKDGSAELGSGLDQLLSGSSTLKSSLSDGAKEINDVSKSNDTVDMFASPVDAQKSESSQVANNGHAMAAYMMCVGLWIACIAFCLIYPVNSYEGELKSGLKWWLSKVSVSYLIIAAASVVMVMILHTVNGFEPEKMGATIGIASLAGITFISVVYFFNALMGKVGSFVMLIFTVVQLAGSAGTYPIEVSGGFVAKIHNFLPFSYTVDAFRKTICGQGSFRSDIVFLLIFAAVFSAASFTVFERRAAKIRQGKSSSTALLEKYGLI